LLYAAFFVVHCRLEIAPPTWDEAYLLQYPVMVRAAWEHQGFWAAVHTFWSTRFMKPPLSMMGTMVPLLLFGTDGVSYRLDNLAVALVAVLVLRHLLGHYLARPWATTLALGILVSPYALWLARSEMAELYLWTALIAWLAVLLPSDPFRTRQRSLALGMISGAGMLAKLSFPLFAIGPSLWALARTLREGRRAGDVSRRLGNVGLAGASGLLLFIPFAAHNWKRMWHHFREQYGWVGEEYRTGNPLRLDYARSYFRTFAEWVGPVWVLLAVAVAVAVVLALATRRAGGRSARDSALPPDAFPWTPLLALFGVNLAYCYFIHPVPEPRFVIGSFLALQLLVALAIGALLAGSAAGARTLLIVPLIMLLASAHLPSGAAVFPWSVPLLGASTRVVAPPARTPDLRDAILARVPGCASICTIGIAGDHAYLNNDNLQLRALELGMPAVIRQIAYAAPDVSVTDRVRELGPVAAWVVIVPSATGHGTSWASRYADPVLDLLEHSPDEHLRIAWDGDLGDGTRVRLYGNSGSAAPPRSSPE
jgi:hypothetical protein